MKRLRCWKQQGPTDWMTDFWQRADPFDVIYLIMYTHTPGFSGVWVFSADIHCRGSLFALPFGEGGAQRRERCKQKFTMAKWGKRRRFHNVI